MKTSKKRRKEDYWFPFIAASVVILASIFLGVYFLVNYASLSKITYSSPDYVRRLPSLSWSAAEKKAAILNLAARAKTSYLFEPEIKYIVKECTGTNATQYHFTLSEQKAVLHAIAQKSP
jgi:hypothetical protein